MKAAIARWVPIVGLLALLSTAAASADEAASSLSASLSGFNEVPPKATDGTGLFQAKASDGTIVFTLTYSGLSTPAFMAHFHFGQPRVNGGVYVWLCGPPGTPAKTTCPAGTTEPATVTGTITAADVVATVPDQGIKAGDFATALRIIEAGLAYVNVHTSMFPGGEIRGQISPGESASD